MAEKIYFQWQKEHLDEQGRILLKLVPLRKRIESLEIEQKKIENKIARLNNPQRLDDILSYFSKANVHGEIRRRFAQADEAVIDAVIDRIGSMIGDVITDFYGEIPQRINLWNDQGRKKNDPTLAWVKDQSEKLQASPKKLDSIIDALEEENKSLQIGSPRLANHLSVLNILSDPEMRAIIAKELDRLEELQAAIDYSQLTQEELNRMIQSEKQKLKVLQNKISQEKAKADDLQKQLEPVESALYITEEKFLAGSSSGRRAVQSASPANLGIRTKKWCFVATDVYNAPNGKKLDKIPNRVPIPQRAVLELTGKQKNIDDSLWSEIIYEYSEYSKNEKKWIPGTVTGWVNSVFLDDYIENYSAPEVKIPNATEDPYDAKQYMFLDADFDGKLDPDVKYNMCGELCVSYIVKYEIDPESNIETVLTKWKNSGKGYRAKTIKEGTNAADLKNILNAYDEYGKAQDEDQIVDFRAGLRDGSLTYDGMKEKLKTHYLIALITIDHSGALIPKAHPTTQTLHWVLIEKFTKNGTRVELYNPFPNKREEYSFSEFVSSCRPSLSGLWVKRKEVIKVDLDIPPSKRSGEVELDVPKPVDYKAEQYIIREGEKKTNLCGEFCVGYIVGKSIDKTMDHWQFPPSGTWELVTILKAYGYYRKDKKDKPAPHTFSIGTVLDHWKDTQPSLYEYHVGKNKPTGTRELRSILRAYGYKDDDFEEFNNGLTDKSTGYLPSPGRMKKKLETHFLIAGVGIDGSTGKLITGPKGVRHWEVLEKLEPIGKHYLDKHFGGNGGWVELYNPFTNILEEYSYREFVDSMSETGNWAGLWVKREVDPTFEPDEILPALIEGKEKKVGRNSNREKTVKRWPEQKLLAEISKKINHDTLPEKIPALLVREGSGWSAGEIAKRLPANKNNGSKLKDELEASVLKHLEVDSLPPEISEWIADKSGGDSIFAIDLAYALRESGILAAEDGKGIIPINLDSPALHETLKSAVTVGIVNASKPSSQTTLNIARTIGVAFSLKAVEEIRNIQVKQYMENKKSALLKNRPESEKAGLPICEFVKWTDSLAVENENLWKVRIWGDPAIEWDVNTVATTNFQAVGLYNKATKDRGAVKNFLTILREDIDNLMALQVEDEFVDKEENWLKQKLNWLCKEKGTIYFTKEGGKDWDVAPSILWGTLALGGNLVRVEGYDNIPIKVPGGKKAVKRMARLAGFKRHHWSWSLDKLLAEGLVHRCFCAYNGNEPGDSPKGIIYSPFFSPKDWRFGEGGHKKPEALYIPVEQLVKPGSKDEDGKEYEGIFQKFNCDEK